MSLLLEFIKNNTGSNHILRLGFFGLGKCNIEILKEICRTIDCEIILRSDREPAYIPELIQKPSRFFGKCASDDINEDILFLSPSVRRDRPELILAKERGVVLTSDADIFFERARDNVFSITGSDGKSTVTTLVSSLLSSSGMNAPAIGNIGTPYILAPNNAQAYVSELSSFNLMYVAPRSVRCAITNITPNHLDWHTSFEEYRDAKLRILENCEGAVLSADDKELRKVISEREVYGIFSTRESYSELKKCFKAQHYLTLDGEYIFDNGKKLVNVSTLKRREEYNLRNMMCAIAMCSDFVEDSLVRESLSCFNGLEHRAELFHYSRGITFINSSIDTTPDRCARTLCALGRKVRVILGGRGKRLPLDALLSPLSKYAAKIGVYGDMRFEIMEFIQSHTELSGIESSAFVLFDDAVDYVIEGAKDADTVLLSPAATGYGEFSDFAERGRHFKEYIRKRFPGDTASE